MPRRKTKKIKRKASLNIKAKILIALFVGFVIFALIHNLFYALYGFEESAFLILALFSIGGIIAVGLFVLVHEIIIGVNSAGGNYGNGKRRNNVQKQQRNNLKIKGVDLKQKNERIIRSKMALGDRFADKITEGIGSWKFIIIQSIILIIWMILNTVAWVRHWDPYPFILLNLALSFQAAYAAPIIMMSQNRSAARDRKKADWDLATDRRAERGIAKIEKDLRRLERGKIAKILKILEENDKK